MTKDVKITVDIAVARTMLCVAGFNREEIYRATEDEVFEKVLTMIDCYGATFETGKTVDNLALN